MSIVIIRALVMYFFVMITMRLLGKCQLGEMELSEFVFAALITDLSANPLQDIGIPMINESDQEILGLDMNWLNNQLSRRHISSPKELMLSSEHDGVFASCDKLIYHLQSLADMEKPSIRSIL